MKVRRPRKKILKMMKVIDTMKWMKGMLVMNLMKMIKVDENDEVNEGENEGGKKPMRLIKVVNTQVRKTIKKITLVKTKMMLINIMGMVNMMIHRKKSCT